MDIQARNAAQRARRKASGNLNTKKYEKTRKGFLMRLFQNLGVKYPISESTERTSCTIKGNTCSLKGYDYGNPLYLRMYARL